MCTKYTSFNGLEKHLLSLIQSIYVYTPCTCIYFSCTTTSFFFISHCTTMYEEHCTVFLKSLKQGLILYKWLYCNFGVDYVDWFIGMNLACRQFSRINVFTRHAKLLIPDLEMHWYLQSAIRLGLLTCTVPYHIIVPYLFCKNEFENKITNIKKIDYFQLLPLNWWTKWLRNLGWNYDLLLIEILPK